MSPNISQEKEQALLRRMDELGIKKEDFHEQFVRAQGPGGQHVNKTSTAVYLKHIPTGIDVKMDESRSQLVNRFLAKRLLVEKIAEKFFGQPSKKTIQTAKRAKQKQRRARKSKKKHQSNEQSG